MIYKKFYLNDPSEGSPTETLLRLLLPLMIKIRASFDRKGTVQLPKQLCNSKRKQYFP